MFKYLLKIQMCCFFTTYYNFGQNGIFRFLRRSSFLTNSITKRGVLGEEFFFSQTFSVKWKFSISAFKQTFNRWERWNTFFKTLILKMQENGQIPLYRLLLKFGAKNWKFGFFEMNSLTIVKCFETWNKTPKPRLFPYLSFHDNLRFFKSHFISWNFPLLTSKMPQLLEDTLISTHGVLKEELC